MLVKTITYTDYDGNKRTEDKYFNMNKAELMELQMGTEGGWSAMVNRILARQDNPALFKTFKDMILRAYGEKSADGRQFMKSEALSTAFAQTEAYSELFMELVTNAEAAAAFLNGIVPADMAEEVAKLTSSNIPNTVAG